MAPEPDKPSEGTQKAVSGINVTPFRLIVSLFLFLIVIFQYRIPLEFLHHTDHLSASKHEFVKPGQLNHGKVAFQTLSKAPELAKPVPRYFMVFSTSCTDQQNWESYLFFFHAFKARQTGTVTRIVSGCNDEQENELRKFHRDYIATMNPNFKVHFTPDFSQIESDGTIRGKQPYKYMNKPYGLRHWMENSLGVYANGTNPKGSLNWIIMLMDPDMVLLRPMTHNFTDIDNHLWVEKEPATRVVAHGRPIAQQDGYLRNEWMKLDFAYITNKTKDEVVERPKQQDGPIHWNTGPPYLATVKDMRNIVEKWTEYAPHVYEIFPKLFAEVRKKNSLNLVP